jgi:hypothetical protein
VEAMLPAASSDSANGRAFNLGGDCVVTLKDLAEMLLEVKFARQIRAPRSVRLCRSISMGIPPICFV